MSDFDRFDRRVEHNSTVNPVTFDRMDHHEYGLIQVRPGVYVKCHSVCCKSGGPVDWEKYSR